MKDECKSFKCTDLHIFRRVECSYYIHSLWKTKRTGYWTQVARSHPHLLGWRDRRHKMEIAFSLPTPPKKTLKKKEAHYSTASNSDLFWGLWKRLVMGLIGQRHLVIEKWNQWLLGSMRPPLCSVLPACSWLLQASRTSGAAEMWARKGWDDIEVHTPSSYYASAPHWHQRCKEKWSHLNPIIVINPPSHTCY